jgi:uncharacterized repeat protein (TIGR01451 family)
MGICSRNRLGLLGLLAALFLGVSAAAGAQAVQTISNTAYVRWTSGSGQNQVASNRVDLTFAAQGAVRLYVPASGLIPQGAAAASCSAASVASSGQPSALSSTALTEAQSSFLGRPIVLSLADSSANLNPLAADTLTTVVTTSSGDRETVTFTETGANTGLFLAVIGTRAAPPSAVAGDCSLSATAGPLQISIASGGAPLGSASVAMLVDPFGITFDSATGAPVDSVRLTLVNAATGLPATVYGDDGTSSYPSTVTVGQRVADSGGTIYDFPPGEYRFPLVAPGTYRLVAEPAAPYSAPSTAPPAQIAALRRPDGQPFTIIGGSYGNAFDLTAAGAVRIDIPLDRPPTPLVIAKSVNITDAVPGDLLRYRIDITNPGPAPSGSVTVTDSPPEQLRFRPGSARLGAGKIADPAAGGGRKLLFTLTSLPGGGKSTLTYVMEVRPGASAGDALNRAQAGTATSSSNVADALVRIRNDDIGRRMVIAGQVLGGGCDPSSTPRGIRGIRVMLEDGSYAVTDADGRYHFEGVNPGTHVVQLDRSTVPGFAEAVDCERDVRSGGSGSSRFVEGLGGELKRSDFHLHPASKPAAPAPSAERSAANALQQLIPEPLSDADAAGGSRDWLQGQEPGIEFLFPGLDYNPRSPVTRVVVKHLPGQSASLFINGQRADAVAFEGTLKDAGRGVAVSTWRGIPLARRSTVLRVEIRGSGGELVRTLQRTIVFANVPAHASLVRERSLLIADGIHRPVLALRITDRSGRPVHHGVTGEFGLPDPYYPAMEADAQQARQLAGLERARPVWHVSGDDGLAYVELEPTTASGTVSMQFEFRDGQSVRQQRLDAWLSPGERPWTIVGLAEGTAGFNRLGKHMEDLGPDDRKDMIDGRLALYAKGKVLGRWLLTLSYDSAKHRRDEQFGGVIDPQLYYTVYADRSERRYDAASVRKLYVRLERPQFYALFGDYDVTIDQPKLAHYMRALNGLKAEYRSRQVAAVTFASDTPLSHRREEIQGNGLSGPYRLRTRHILANSERVVIQVRDRFRSEKIVEEQQLNRHVDYDIDYETGTLIFRSPVLSRSSSLDPQFIIVDYDVDEIARTTLNAGGRVSWTSPGEAVQAGATFVHDNDGDTRTNLAGADIKVRVDGSTEVRGEIAASRSRGSAAAKGTPTAWLVEVEHHDRKLDALAYAIQQDLGFGVGQTNGSELGTRKFGIDARWRFDDRLSLTGSAWHQQMLADGASRDALRLLAEYRQGDLSSSAGLTYAHDELADGREATSTLLTLAGTKQLDHGRLELGASSEIPLGGIDSSIDFPARYRLTARFAATPWASLISSYEIAKGRSVDARTARIGFDLAPWAGLHIALSGNAQDIPEYGRRTYAAFGLAQSVILSKNWSVDVSLDSNRTIGGIDPARVINPLHPVASGGFVGDGSTITEDFTALTAGATYRAGRLSVTGRGEYRFGELENRAGIIFGALRQIGEGRALGTGLNWFRASEKDGSTTSVAEANVTWANRPSGRPFSWLDKLELRRDAVTNAVAGASDPLGNVLSVSGDARSLRLVNALTLNGSSFDNRVEWSLFWGSRYVSDKFGEDDVNGWSNVFASDFRASLGDWLEIGAAGSLRLGNGARTASYSVGPQVGLRPFKNGWLAIGYNVAGYSDRDFAADRFTRAGAYATLRLKFDELSLASLGLLRR